MKKILTMLGAITLIGTTTINIIACGGGEKPKPLISVKKTDVEVTNDIKTALENGVDGSSLNDSQKQSDAKDLIIAAIKQVIDADKVGDASFTFIDSNTSLTQGENKVNINVTFGSSNNVGVAVKLTQVTKDTTKTNLKTITKLTGLNLIVNFSDYYYYYLEQNIAKANEFKNTKITKFSIIFYRDAQKKHDISYQKQEEGDVYVVITADTSDPYWSGETQILKITLNL